MKKITLADYNKIHPDFRGVWTTERTDWADWEQVKHKYMGKRTMSGFHCLEVEGLSFEIVVTDWRDAFQDALQQGRALAIFNPDNGMRLHFEL